MDQERLRRKNAMRFRFGVKMFGFWKITVIAMPVEKVPKEALAYLMGLDGKTVGGQGVIFASVE